MLIHNWPIASIASVPQPLILDIGSDNLPSTLLLSSAFDTTDITVVIRLQVVFCSKTLQIYETSIFL
jgi:hypothetical protein